MADKLIPGWHFVKIVKLIYGTREKDFQSESGYPQMMVVVEDRSGSQASQMFTLSPKAAWTLAKLMSRFSVDLDGLERRNIEPIHFENRDCAEEILLGRVGWIYAEQKGQYLNFEAFHQEEVPAEIIARERQEAARSGPREPEASEPSEEPRTQETKPPARRQRHEPISEDDIPF